MQLHTQHSSDQWRGSAWGWGHLDYSHRGSYMSSNMQHMTPTGPKPKSQHMAKLQSKEKQHGSLSFSDFCWDASQLFQIHHAVLQPHSSNKAVIAAASSKRAVCCKSIREDVKWCTANGFIVVGYRKWWSTSSDSPPQLGFPVKEGSLSGKLSQLFFHTRGRQTTAQGPHVAR